MLGNIRNMVVAPHPILLTLATLLLIDSLTLNLECIPMQEHKICFNMLLLLALDKILQLSLL